MGIKTFVLLVLMGVSMASSTMDQDEKDCAEQITNLAACIPFVSGSAKKPSQQCCDETVKVRSNTPKCLCVLIKESTDPSMGLPVNTTLALQMPSACNIDAKVSDCPSILKLPPNSPDAKIFKDPGAGSTTAATSTTTPPSSPSSSDLSSNSGSKATPSSNTGASSKAFGIESVIGFMVCVAWIFT